MRRNDTLFNLAQWLTDPPSGGPIQMWFVGVGLSSIVAIYGLSCCLSQRATTINLTNARFQSLPNTFSMEISGIHAVIYGLLILFVGLFMHFQWFWGLYRPLQRFYEIGKFLSFVGVLASVLSLIFTMITRT